MAQLDEVSRAWVLPVASSELSDEENRQLARELYDRWTAGEKKSPLEVEYFGKPASHGKYFSGFIKKWLGLQTETRSAQSEHVAKLEAMLRAHGISPTDAGDLAEEYRLLAKSRESALAAIRIYNDPGAGFRSETFIVLMIIAWNSLLQAILERDSIDYYRRDEGGRVVEIAGRGRVKDTAELIELALPDDSQRPTRMNLDFFLGLRNQIAHRYLPALDPLITEEAQSMLLNFERVLTERFGIEAALAERLSVPLQLSGFRNTNGQRALRRAQVALPIDVTDYLARHRAGVPEDVLRSSDYALRIYFVPVAANHERSADAAVHFVSRSEYPELVAEFERQIAVVDRPRQIAVASADLFRPGEVVRLVAEQLPFRFTSDTHTRAWKHFRVRPATDSAEPESTNQRFCKWDRLMRGYGYTQAWIDHLVTHLSTVDDYAAVAGVQPDRR
jgi:Protein of unknown function (DUF3644)